MMLYVVLEGGMSLSPVYGLRSSSQVEIRMLAWIRSVWQESFPLGAPISTIMTSLLPKEKDWSV